MTLKNVLRTTALGAALNGMVFAQAQTPAAPAAPPAAQKMHARAFRHGAMNRRNGVRGKLMASYLGLSDQQQAQAKTIRQNARAAAQPVIAQLRENRASIRTAIQNGQPVDQLANTQGQLVAKLITLRANAREQFRALLTPEQQQKLQQLHKNPNTETPAPTPNS